MVFGLCLKTLPNFSQLKLSAKHIIVPGSVLLHTTSLGLLLLLPPLCFRVPTVMTLGGLLC